MSQERGCWCGVNEPHSLCIEGEYGCDCCMRAARAVRDALIFKAVVNIHAKGGFAVPMGAPDDWLDGLLFSADLVEKLAGFVDDAALREIIAQAKEKG